MEIGFIQNPINESRRKVNQKLEKGGGMQRSLGFQLVGKLSDNEKAI